MNRCALVVTVAMVGALFPLSTCLAQGGPASTDVQRVLGSITAADLRRHTEALAHDSMEGRLPGSAGERRTVRYITGQLRALGVPAGNPKTGGYTQMVPLRALSYQVLATASLSGRTDTLGAGDLGWSRQLSASGQAIRDAEVVFVGNGTADQYGAVDVRGKVVVVLHAPDFRARWRLGVQKGAAAVLVINEEQRTGITMRSLDPARARVVPRTVDSVTDALRGWLSATAAESFFGRTVASLTALAARSDFVPVIAPARISIAAQPRIVEFESANIVARIEGSDHALRNEHVIFSAHWDHLGRDSTLTGDQIYNGAVDNAGGVAQLLAIAGAFKRLGVRPRRSVLFLFTTAEEVGLVGAQYYTSNPLYPLARTVAAINLDWFFPYGRTRDMIVIGHGSTTLEDVLADALRGQSRIVTPDPSPEEQFYLRSDHYPFAQQGVPALFAGMGVDYINRPKGWGKVQDSTYAAAHYHHVSDEVRRDWDYSGAMEDARVLFTVGYNVARNKAPPEWKLTADYAAYRARWEAMRKGRDTTASRR